MVIFTSNKKLACQSLICGMQKKRWIAIIIGCVLVSGCSYTKDLSDLSREQATADLDFLAQKIREIHPKPFAYVSESEFDAFGQQAKQRLGEHNRRIDLSLMVAEWMAMIRNNHTQLNEFPDFQEYMNKGGKIFPLGIRYRQGQMMVNGWYEHLYPQRIANGHVITALNDERAEDLWRDLRKYLSAETDELKDHVLEAWPSFSRLLWLARGPQETFALQLKDPNGDLYIEQIPALGHQKAQSNKAVVTECKSPWHHRFLQENDLCWFTVTSFDTGGDIVAGRNATLNRFRSVMEDMFAAMKTYHTSVLVVDLRNNGGGSGDLSFSLLRRVAQKPYKESTKYWRYSKAYQKACLIYGLERKKVPAWLHLENVLDLRKFRWGPDASQMRGEYSSGDPNGVTMPDANAWQGKLVVLTNHYTASAASNFAVIVKDNNLGILAGEETLGRASEYSEIIWVILPNSGLYCMIPSAHFVRPAGYDDGRGVLPDLPLDVTRDCDTLAAEIYSYVKGLDMLR